MYAKLAAAGWRHASDNPLLTKMNDQITKLATKLKVETYWAKV
jgi:hypothetical protein